ncbi:MAG: CheR family methyltransferase [Candidatus Kariarchaeaceae archaeon]|jgi:chemotaxis protein methyltransferase CheR
MDNTSEKSSGKNSEDTITALFALNPMSKEERRAYYSKTTTYRSLMKKFRFRGKRKIKTESPTQVRSEKKKKRDSENVEEDLKTDFPDIKEIDITKPMTKKERRAYYSQTEHYRKFARKYKMKNQVLDKEKLKLIIQYLGSNGFSSNSYNERFLIRRIRARMLRTNIDKLDGYYSYLKRDHNELELLKKSISILVTRFFRDRDSFDYLTQQILTHPKQEQINFWSAGCADGAEAYTLAMLGNKMNIDYSILASDVKQELINQAENAVYPVSYLKELSKKEIKRYFQKINPLKYQIADEIKKSVSFKLLDLMNDLYPNDLDIILCRNVLIYFEPEMENEVIKKFYHSLKPGGYLMLGRTEIVDKQFTNKFELISSKHRIYRKI